MPCASANCGVRRYKWVYGNVFANPYYSGGSWVLTSGCNADGEDYICSPSNSTPPGPILGSCGGAFAAYHTWLCSEFGEIPGVDCQNSGPHEILGTGLGCFDVACTCVDSGNCGEANCGPTETCCDGTTCVATDSFQTDNNRCGDCNTVCEAGQICVDGACAPDCTSNGCSWTWTVPQDCCIDYHCVDIDNVRQYYPYPRTVFDQADCSHGDSSLPCDYGPWADPVRYYSVFSQGACPPEFICFVCDQPNNSATPCISGSTCPDGYTLGEFPAEYTSSGGDVYCTQHTGIRFHIPCVPSQPGSASSPSWVAVTCPVGCECPQDPPSRNGAYPGEVLQYTCTPPDCRCGDEPPDPDPDCGGPAPLSVTKQPEMMPNLGPSIADGPCSQEECEAHVSTWMAEASGKPNEEGLYKVKWILLDGCPGACCSDQPTQPEFVKKSTLVDAPCKCGCS